MAVATKITVFHERAGDFQAPSGLGARDILRRAIGFLSGCAAGAYPGAYAIEVAQESASGTVTAGTVDGTLSITVNGVEISLVAGDSSEATIAAFAQAITNHPSPLVRHQVDAVAEGSTLTLTAMCPGFSGNAVTVSVAGTGLVASGPRLTGGFARVIDF